MTIEDGKPRAIGWAQIKRIIDDDKAAANEFWKVAKKLARDLGIWIPVEANNEKYIDYEGRKPRAMITIEWEGDFNLVVDGKVRKKSKDKKELKEEAERIGAELEETHTP